MEGACREPNVVECECGGGGGGAGGGATLDVLNDVQRAYEQQMSLLDRLPCSKRMPMQVNVLKQWVCDLTAQNSLLARAVEELEAEASTRLFVEQRKNMEVACEMRAELGALRRRLARKDADLRGLLEVLRRLRDLDYCGLDGIHFFEVTESDIFGDCDWHPKKMGQGDLRNDMKHGSVKMNYHTRDRSDL